MALTQRELESMIEKTMQLTLKLWEEQLAFNKNIEFLIYEMLKFQALYLKDKGMNVYYQEKLAELQHKRVADVRTKM